MLNDIIAIEAQVYAQSVVLRNIVVGLLEEPERADMRENIQAAIVKMLPEIRDARTQAVLRLAIGQVGELLAGDLPG